MNYRTFVNRICDDGIAEVAVAYTDANKIDGARAGFEEARQTVDAHDLMQVLAAAKADTIRARNMDAEQYWWWRIRELQVEWVANVVSASLYNRGEPVIVPPTLRAWDKAADILGRAA